MAFARTALILGLAFVSLTTILVEAKAANSLYDMSRFLSEPHPFARVTQSQTPQPRPTVRPLSSDDSIKTVTPVPPKIKLSELKSNGTLEPETAINKKNLPWVSEFRTGILKHAVSLIGNASKETGIDGNLEILFNSPDWLNFLWSPRPHIGASFNSSTNNTDVAYAGLTWEKEVWHSVFLNFSFGGATHNGKLSYDAGVPFPSDYNRHREFGCRALFRESFEIGWNFAKPHRLSTMWSHYSHAGLCGDQNEGLDNLGIRYGYHF